MFIKATQYINKGFAIYLKDIKANTNSINIRITYYDINPLLEWLKCNNTKLIYDEDISITSVDPRIVPASYEIVSGYYKIDISYKDGLFIIDNQSITIGLVKGEKSVYINFPQSAYKLL